MPSDCGSTPCPPNHVHQEDELVTVGVEQAATKQKPSTIYCNGVTEPMVLGSNAITAWSPTLKDLWKSHAPEPMRNL
ncbi:hypothetical protein KPH14_012981, partial [Odynerus spinipes]